MKCINCGHGSALKSNFKRTPDGKAYCIKNELCVGKYELYADSWNEGARQKGDKVND